MGWKLINLLQQFEKKLRQRVGPSACLVKDQVHRARRDRHGVFVIVNPRAPVFHGYLDVLALEFGAILIAKNGQKKLVAQGGLERLPVNVRSEERRVGK